MEANFSQTVLPTSDNVTRGADSDAYLYKLGADLFIVVDVLLVGGGCTGNVLAFALTMRRRLRQVAAVSVFIAALAVVDTFVLVLDFINNWLLIQLEIDLFTDITFCIFHRWFFNVCYTTSAWYVASVAVERFTAVYFPLKARVWCTFKKALITVVVIPVLLGIIYMYNFWSWEINPEHGSCDIHADYAMLMTQVSPWLTAVLYSYIPIVIIVSCNLSIVYRLARAQQKRQAMTGETSTDQTSVKVTVMMVAVCIAYVVTTVPLSIWYIYVFATKRFVKQTAEETFTEICILILALGNHAINFYLYVLTSQNFRSEIVIMLGCAKVQRHRSTDSLNTEQSVVSVTRT